MYLAILILSSVVISSLAIITLLLGEFKISGDIEDSMKAINSAGSGLEKTLYEARVDDVYPDGPGSVVVDTTCSALGLSSIDCSVNIDPDFTDTPGNLYSICDTTITCTKIESTGTSGSFNRKIQTIYENK